MSHTKFLYSGSCVVNANDFFSGVQFLPKQMHEPECYNWLNHTWYFNSKVVVIPTIVTNSFDLLIYILQVFATGTGEIIAVPVPMK